MAYGQSTGLTSEAVQLEPADTLLVMSCSKPCHHIVLFVTTAIVNPLRYPEPAGTTKA